MSRSVGKTLLRSVLDHGVDVDFDTLEARYRATAEGLVDQYELDAAFNGFEFDRGHERDQISRYAEAVAAPTGPDDRLPAWTDAPLDADAIADAAAADVAEAVEATASEPATASPTEAGE
jgi:glucosyl-3-phosphoglycerate synthase